MQREGRPVDVSFRKGVHLMKQNVCKFKPRRFNTWMTFGGRGEISVGCEKSGSFQFYPWRGYGSFLDDPMPKKIVFQKQHFCNAQPNM